MLNNQIHQQIMYDAISKVIKVLKLTKEMTLKLWWSIFFNNLINKHTTQKGNFKVCQIGKNMLKYKKEANIYAQVIN